jgi:phosphatidylglycerol---prolipoprotein diacylglyceryl transferase
MFLHSYIPNAVLLDLGFYQIRWYGLCLALAAAGGFFVVLSLVRRHQDYDGQASDSFDKDKIFNLLFWVAVWGIIGGRIVHVLTFFSYYWQRPLQILAIWNGGIAFYGVFLGGLIAAGILAHRVILSEGPTAVGPKSKDPLDFPYKKGEGIPRSARNDKESKSRNSKFEIRNSLLFLLDALVVGLSFGQFIGRWGNWFNQELIGAPTNLPWGIPIDVWHRPLGFENFQYFHPVFLYESLFSLILFLGLFLIYRKKYCHAELVSASNNKIPKQVRDDRAGQVFALFLIFHSTARFFLEFLRLDVQPEILGLRMFQWVAVLEFIVGLIVYFYVRLCYNKSNTNYKSDTNIQMYK